MKDDKSSFIKALNNFYGPDYEFIEASEYRNRLNFNSVFKNKGGYYNPKNDFVKDHLKGCKIHLDNFNKQNPNTPRVHFSFIDNPNLGASCGLYKNEYYIGINIGAIFVLYQVFYRMLSQKNILPLFGNSNSEIEVDKMFNSQISNINQIVDELPSPKDPERKIIANVMTINSLKYLLMHEFAHIHFGHLDLMAKGENLDWSKSISYRNLKEFNNFFIQTLEYDADCFASSHELKKLLYLHDDINNVIDEIKYIYKDLEFSLKIWLFSIYSTFRLMNEKVDKNTDLQTLKYPPASIRQRIVIGMISVIFDLYPKIDKNDIKNLCNEIVREVEVGFNSISETSTSSVAYNSTFTKEVSDHLQKINKNWNIVRPFLEEFTYGKLAPIYK